MTFIMKKFLVLMLIALWCQPVLAATRTVSTYAELTEALADASTDVIAVAGNITVETSLAVRRSVTIKAAEGTKPVLTLTGSSGGVINSSTTGITLTLDGLTLTGGKFGGLYILSGASSFDITNCTFTGNTSSWYGGGILAFGPVFFNIDGCVFSNNTSRSDNGGGVYLSVGASAAIKNSTFTGNKAARHGGGLYVATASSADVVNCTFTGNTAERNGGGLLVRGDGRANVINCTFAGNTASSGAEIYSEKSSSTPAELTLINSVIWNSGTGYIRTECSMDIYNCAYGTGAILAQSDSVAVTEHDCISDLDWTGREASLKDGMAVFSLTDTNPEDVKLINKGLTAEEISGKVTLLEALDLTKDQEGKKRTGRPDLGAVEAVYGENDGGNSEDDGSSEGRGNSRNGGNSENDGGSENDDYEGVLGSSGGGCDSGLGLAAVLVLAGLAFCKR